MTADDLLLPERADLYVTIDHARLPDAHTVLEYGRFTGLVASAMVMRMLKRPLLDDVAVGQAESDAALELPFELVRWVGMLRFDHTCVSLSWPREIGGETTWTATSVGSFSPSRIASSVRGLQVEGFESALADKRATAKWTGGSASVTSRVATGCAVGVDVAPREALAKQLLRDGVHSVRLFAPEGSKLIPLLRASGFANTIACEMEVTWGDPMLTVEKLTMKDEAAASAMAGKVALLFERVLEQYGLGDHIEKIAPTEVTVASNVVTCVRKVPQAVLQSFFADWRTKTLANARTRRLPR
jgi:hypothetical protein